MLMIRSVIVEDEIKSRETLRGMINRYTNDVVILGEADGVMKGLELIKNIKPDLVFLDIQMPDGSGFKLLELIKEPDFEVIFTTAYDQYAIKAIKFSALDYLLKPIVPEDLQAAIEKMKKRSAAAGLRNLSYKTLKSNLEDHQGIKPSKIVLSTAEKIHVVEVDNIIRCESDNYYTKYFFENETSLLVSKTLKETEELLKEHRFIRPHKSHLVNINYIVSFIKSDGGHLKLRDGSLIPVSRRKRETILEILNSEI